MHRRLLINEQPSFASIGYSHQQLSRVPRGTANRHSQFHCPKLKISKVWFALEYHKNKGNKDWVFGNQMRDTPLDSGVELIEREVKMGGNEMPRNWN